MSADGPTGAAHSRHDVRNVTLLWLIASAIMTPIVVYVFGPGLPPGHGSNEAAGQVVDNTVLLALATPLALGVLVFVLYSVWAFRDREPQAQGEAAAVGGNSSVQFWWIVVSTTVALSLTGYGTIRLLETGAGGGQGPEPIAIPAHANHALQVQVIAQQWQFTYRWPSFGGVETRELELPAHTLIEFNVTSLDVIHSFWAYQLGVKADANPGVNNIAYVTTRGPLPFEVRCAELCGVWHGYMYNPGRVVPRTSFTSWITGQRIRNAPSTRLLEPYSKTYFPEPQRRGG
ncbi:MAG TPA: cytochrome c oxidase subunit II [Solirubrobacteraceae bacterium]|nr:cytochrome c oxidase subunit II [Solirubrobacteraceae bacterium]